jgi:hypothetical protein
MAISINPAPVFSYLLVFIVCWFLLSFGFYCLLATLLP